MNSIFIYLFFSVGGAEVLRRFFTPFATSFFSWGGEITAAIIASLLYMGSSMVSVLLAL